ncbi:NYN domain-containing protein [Mesorhizobium xinjiangense]|uniref:NYN domain-containing protein n=1 Tax=Mesorhizobium xinjiangense TaxID=2678685 RepID=UPI0012ED94ED|nr:NYN domain-containing protein [Mesorhizobium xinjiangense]
MSTDLQPRRARLALLIDADNIRADFLPIIVREASALGTVTVKRVYGHFGSSSMNAWQPLVHDYALTPVHIPPAAVGKNATDMKLAIEAMDLLHRGQIEGFCIASSDSDFTTLASRIREDGVSVYGFGEQKASQPYVRSCDRFFYCDRLLKEERREEAAAEVEDADLPSDEILTAVEDTSGEDGWANLGEVGQILTKRMPEFDPRNYGFRKLSNLMEAMKKVELRRSSANGGGVVQVKRK